MKKFRSYIAVLLVMLVAVTVFVACDDWVHQHEYTEWGSNSTSHWKFCALDKVADTTTIDVHHDNNNDGICDECSYSMGIACDHTHDYSAWGYDKDSHWKYCTVDNAIDASSIASHSDPNKDGKCDECGYVMSSSGGDITGGDITGGNDYNYNYNLSEVFKKYETSAGYNFKVIFDAYDLIYDETEPWYTFTYGYKDIDTLSIAYEEEGENYLDYYSYAESKYYSDNGDGTYYLMDENNEYYDIYLLYYLEEFDISTLNDLTFTHFDRTGTSSTSEPSPKQNQYVADNAVLAGNAILGEWDNDDTQNISWTKVEIYLFEEDIEKIVAYCSGTFVNEGETEEVEEKYVLTFSDFGEIDFDLSKLTIDNGDDDNQGGGNQGGDDDQGGNQGGNTGGDTQTNATYTAVFTDQYLSADCDVEFSTTSKANSFMDGRGVQYMQADGAVNITSTRVSNVTKVILVVQSNADNGMKVSVSVGSTKLTSDGNTIVSIAKQKDFSTLTTVEFVASSGVDGVVTITMTPTGSKKSMIINTVTIVCGGGSSSGGTSTGVMPEQAYDADKHDNSTLREQMQKYFEGYSDPLPLQSTGSYNCLVVPVQFGSNPISTAQLNRLNDAFNGASTTTGWESVSSYYKKSSYNKLNLAFDISGIFTAKESVSYYEKYNGTISIDGVSYDKTGDLLILEEVMAWLEDQYDLTKYDTDNDGVLDAIWLIYSAPVCTNDDSIYWAYVTTYGQDDNEEINKYDGLELGYYLFAGLDFMDDYTGKDNDQKYYSNYTDAQREAYAIDGMITNACTYIHETGHLLGLDDYYDYYEGGSEVGLGGADMMDYTVGDHCSYSKLMLGWVEPTVVTTTQTVTINPFESSGNAIMLLLDYNGTNFCEYLLIDLYTKTGLNEAHGNQYGSYLYDGAEYGIRVYHVSSNIDDPYSDGYYSFTTNNNSLSDDALIKLVSANGGYITTETDEDGYAKDYAKSSDLFQTGDTLASYKRNDGKTVNFTITFTSVSADGATVSITF